MDKRLKLCAEFVKGDYVCDVGTDHALLPCALILNGFCQRAIAADVNEGPLEAAESNIKKYGLSNRIMTELSDGLDSITTKGLTDIVIAGMGGELIADILGRGLLQSKINNQINFILQPMSKASYLRMFLCENGFLIKNERAVTENSHTYTVINAVYTGETYVFDIVNYEIGFMDFSLPDEAEYANKVIEKLKKRIDGLVASGDTTMVGEMEAVINQIEDIIFRGKKLCAE